MNCGRLYWEISSIFQILPCSHSSHFLFFNLLSSQSSIFLILQFAKLSFLKKYIWVNGGEVKIREGGQRYLHHLDNRSIGLCDGFDG
jgi:hypothetical protein